MSVSDILALIVWFVVRPFLKLAPMKALYKMAGAFSFFAYLLSPRKRKNVREELEKLFPDKGAQELDAVVRRAFELYYKRQSEDIVFEKMSKEFIDANVSIEGIEHVDAALSKGRGAIILVSHFGSFLFVPLVLTFKDYKMTQLAGGPKLVAPISFARQIIGRDKYRKSNAQPVRFCRADTSLSDVYKVLKRNELLAIAFDGRAGSNWVEVEMLGRKAMVRPGPVRMAMKARAPIIPAFMVRNEDDTQRLILEDQIEMRNSGDYDEDVQINMQKVAAVFERYVAKYPSHYALTLRMMRLKHKLGKIDYPLFP